MASGGVAGPRSTAPVAAFSNRGRGNPTPNRGVPLCNPGECRSPSSPLPARPPIELRRSVAVERRGDSSADRHLRQSRQPDPAAPLPGEVTTGGAAGVAVAEQAATVSVPTPRPPSWSPRLRVSFFFLAPEQVRRNRQVPEPTIGPCPTTSHPEESAQLHSRMGCCWISLLQVAGLGNKLLTDRQLMVPATPCADQDFRTVVRLR